MALIAGGFTVPSDQLRNLVTRLHQLVSSPDRKLFVLLGAGATQPLVPGVPEMISAARAFAERCTSTAGEPPLRPETSPISVRATGVQDQKINEYAEALNWVQQVRGQDGVRAVVQQAALSAYRGADYTAQSLDPMHDDSFRELENQLESWRLTDGLSALSQIVRDFASGVASPVFTTNFDPLIEIALRHSSLETRTFAVVDDHAAPFGYRPARNERIVVHLHGDCYGPTLHTPAALGRVRPALERWISSLLRGSTLLIVGYSGWDDIIHRILRSELEAQPSFEVLWAVYEEQSEHSHINPSLDEFFLTNAVAVTPYYGVDRDQLFTELLERLRRGNFSKVSTPEPPAPASPAHEVIRDLTSRYHFGVSHFKPTITPDFIFWPHRLREPHLIHGVHALTAIMFARLGISIELHLDDTGISPERSSELTDEFRDAVTAWFHYCGVASLPRVTRTSDLIEERGASGSEHLWQLTQEFFSHTSTAFDLLVATKTLDPREQTFAAPVSRAHRMLRPVYTWFALERALERSHTSGGRASQVVTLGGEDEQKMWDLWHGRPSAPAIANLYVPRLDSPTGGTDLWNYHELWRDAPYSGSDLERFSRRMSQGGKEGELVLEWVFTSALRLAVAASGGQVAGLRYEAAELVSWGEALDALRHDPWGFSQTLASSVSQWFHAEGPPRN